MTDILIIILFCVLVVSLVIVFFLISRQQRVIKGLKESNDTFFKDLSSQMKEYHKENKDDYERAQTSQREELSERIKDFNNSFSQTQKLQLDKMQILQTERLKAMESKQDERLKSLEESQKERLLSIEKTQAGMVQSTEKSLEKMRATVEEKLDKTLNERISKSFETVGNQLDSVKTGLTQMRELAKDVGGLKKVLSNVKMRGGLGEVQLQMLLEQYLAPGQFVANAHTGADKSAVVEFAVRFPGQDGNPVLLPIDSKFPKDKYDALLEAYDSGDKERIDAVRKEFTAAVKQEGKNISKYINVPETTRFAIMFLPFEGLYAEIARDASLLETLQREFNVTVAGPTNLAAILNSFQMGFKTLAIQKKGNDVWKVLGEVKTEFGKFGDMLQKAKGKIEGGLKDMDTLISTRTNQINRKLKDVEALPTADEAPNRYIEEE